VRPVRRWPALLVAYRPGLGAAGRRPRHLGPIFHAPAEDLADTLLVLAGRRCLTGILIWSPRLVVVRHRTSHRPSAFARFAAGPNEPASGVAYPAIDTPNALLPAAGSIPIRRG
jgi:hypothetical protein